jgi:hypothetical protein
VWSTLLALVAFGEFPDLASLFGMLVIIAAGLLEVNWQRVGVGVRVTQKASMQRLPQETP